MYLIMCGLSHAPTVSLMLHAYFIFLWLFTETPNFMRTVPLFFNYYFYYYNYFFHDIPLSLARYGTHTKHRTHAFWNLQMNKELELDFDYEGWAKTDDRMTDILETHCKWGMEVKNLMTFTDGLIALCGHSIQGIRSWTMNAVNTTITHRHCTK